MMSWKPNWQDGDCLMNPEFVHLETDPRLLFLLAAACFVAAFGGHLWDCWIRRLVKRQAQDWMLRHGLRKVGR